MTEDKYAPKAEDGVKEIHAKALWHIRDQQAENKKAREDAKKPKPVPTKPHEGGQEAPPTQPPSSESPANPSAPQLQPTTEEPKPVTPGNDFVASPQQLPDGNLS